MQTILEYIKKTKTSEYGNVVIVKHPFDKGVNGVRIIASGQDFVILSNNNVGSLNYKQAVQYAKNNGGELPTVEQWRLISEHIEEIDKRLDETGGQKISMKTCYWTSETVLPDKAIVWYCPQKISFPEIKTAPSFVRVIKNI